MNEVRYHPIVSDEGEMVPLFFTNDHASFRRTTTILRKSFLTTTG